MDIVYLSELRVQTVIGVFAWERQIEQTLLVDLEMAADIPRAAASDALEDTVDYKAVAKRVQAFAGEHRFALVETLAERLAQVLLEEFDLEWLRLRVNKAGAVRGARAVGVVIERSRRDR